jgi:hypothetical protein
VVISPPDDLDRLSHAELKGLVVKQWEQMVELQRLVAAQRDEIARLASTTSMVDVGAMLYHGSTLRAAPTRS